MNYTGMDEYSGLSDAGGAGLSAGGGAGLLDKINEWSKDPRNSQALLAFGANLLSGRQANAGTALNAAMAARKSYDEDLQKKQLQQFQMQDILAQSKLRTAQGQKAMQGLDLQNSFLSRLAGGGAPSAGGPPMAEMAGGMQSGAPTTPNQGGLSGMSLNDLGVAAVAGVPGAKELLDIKKTQMQGTPFEQGKTYRFENGTERQIPKLGEGQIASPQGAVSNAPGYVDAATQSAAATAGATEGAKAGMDVISVPDGRGGTISLPRAIAVKMLGGGQAAQGAPAGIPPAVLAANAANKPFVATQAPGQDVQFQQPPAQLGRAMSPADTTYANETAKNSVEIYKGIQDAGMKAPSQIAKYKQLGSLLEGVDGNKLSGTGVEISRVANSLGLKLDPKLANKEAAAAITNELALSLRDPSQGGGMPGAMSDADRQFLLNSVPNLGQSAAGRQKMIDMKVKVNERNATVAEMARKWQSRFGRIDAPAPDGKDFQSLLQSWSNQNPLFQ